MKQKKGRSIGPLASILLTLLAIVLCLALPLFTMMKNNETLLRGSYERTRKAGTLSLSADDIYLTRVLKKYAGRYQIEGYDRAANDIFQMYAINSTVLCDYAAGLFEAQVLPEGWFRATEYWPEECYQASDSLGFTNYISVPQKTNRGSFMNAGMVTEKQTDKVIGYFCMLDEEVYSQLNLQDAGVSVPDTANAMVAYLGMDILPDWKAVEGTRQGEYALYSEKGELLVYCRQGTDNGAFYQYLRDFEDRAMPRPLIHYLCISAVSISPEQMQSWKEYEASFDSLPGVQTGWPSDHAPAGQEAEMRTADAAKESEEDAK